jgi:threonine dehydrogenase-like Zn-dependent dehydrogenase
VRGISPPCAFCGEGREALCRNVTRGDISSGIQTGYCRDTGGGFSHSLVAHEAQVFLVPTELSDDAAVLIEPCSCALHGALRTDLRREQTALVLGCGGIGLLTIAALRATGCAARIVAVARYEHQRQLARTLGATEILASLRAVKDRYASWARSLDAQVLDPELGKPTVIGGADVTFDCVGSSDTIDDGLRFTQSGGTFMLVGMPGIATGVDWTSMWFKELTVHAAYAYGPERRADGASTQPTFELAIELMRTWQDRLTRLIGPAFALGDYRAAFAAALSTGKTGFAKTVFSIDGSTS